MLSELFNILENFDLASMEHNGVEYIRTVSEAMKLATIDKDTHVGDPAFFNVPYDKLCSKEYAKTLADKIKKGEIAKVERVGADGGKQESKQTTHTAVVDKDMNAVSVTHSLGMPSGVIPDGIGAMFNGEESEVCQPFPAEKQRKQDSLLVSPSPSSSCSLFLPLKLANPLHNLNPQDAWLCLILAPVDPTRSLPENPDSRPWHPRWSLTNRVSFATLSARPAGRQSTWLSCRCS